ncbi:MAG TPA: DUF4394 domain-containing protein [Hyphomicrobiaceae bacterium]|nr:DUF4394 domain-containing protein [Hyphomicrobiaceae bacterium]
MTIDTILRGAVSAAAAVGALTLAAATHASAATVAALQDGSTIAWIDTDKKAVTGSAKLAGGATLIGFDVRPADGRLYGVTPDGAIVIVDPMTGKWEKKSQLSEKLPTGVTFVVDFNPVADRMRLMASDGTNFRVNVDDGKAVVDGTLKYAEGDKDKKPRVTAGAYSNSFAGSKETALYDIDLGLGLLVKQAPPNDGVLNGIGKLGIKVMEPVAFDIWSDGKGANAAWLLTGGTLHSVDLATGAAKPVGSIAGLKGKVWDMAILPSK